MSFLFFSPLRAQWRESGGEGGETETDRERDRDRQGQGERERERETGAYRDRQTELGS